MLQKSNDVFSQHWSIQKLIMELYKIKSELAPLVIVSGICKRNAFYGLEREELKHQKRITVNIFKSDVRKWICMNILADFAKCLY